MRKGAEERKMKKFVDEIKAKVNAEFDPEGDYKRSM